MNAFHSCALLASGGVHDLAQSLEQACWQQIKGDLAVSPYIGAAAHSNLQELFAGEGRTATERRPGFDVIYHEMHRTLLESICGPDSMQVRQVGVSRLFEGPAFPSVIDANFNLSVLARAELPQQSAEPLDLAMQQVGLVEPISHVQLEVGMEAFYIIAFDNNLTYGFLINNHAMLANVGINILVGSVEDSRIAFNLPSLSAYEVIHRSIYKNDARLVMVSGEIPKETYLELWDADYRPISLAARDLDWSDDANPVMPLSLTEHDILHMLLNTNDHQYDEYVGEKKSAEGV